LIHWHEEHLRPKVREFEGVTFFGDEKPQASVAESMTWAIFPKNTPHFRLDCLSMKINHRVDNLDALLTHLSRALAQVDPH
jgi:hypothetical protein